MFWSHKVCTIVFKRLEGKRGLFLLFETLGTLGRGRGWAAVRLCIAWKSMPIGMGTNFAYADNDNRDSYGAAWLSADAAASAAVAAQHLAIACRVVINLQRPARSVRRPLDHLRFCVDMT